MKVVVSAGKPADPSIVVDVPKLVTAYYQVRSAGCSFLDRNAEVWSTDKDGIIPCLLSAEITARLDKDPGERYRELPHDLGDPVYERIDAPATPSKKPLLKNYRQRISTLWKLSVKRSSRFCPQHLGMAMRLAELR